jgi:uncharacterized protein YndB with AHSA1/START domain
MKKSEIENETIEQHLPENEKRNEKALNTESKGAITLDKEHGTLKFEIKLSCQKEVVWKAITELKEVSEWMSNYQGVFEGYKGGTIDLVNTVTGSHVTGEILVCEPYRVLEYEWHIEPNQIFPRGEPESVIRWELKQDGNSDTLLTLTHSRLTKTTSLSFAPGWHAYLDRLEAHLNNEELPDWMHRFGEVKDLYS